LAERQRLVDDRDLGPVAQVVDGLADLPGAEVAEVVNGG
jgi:hypothetical protein